MNYLCFVLYCVILVAAFAISQASQEKHVIQTRSEQNESRDVPDSFPVGSTEDTIRSHSDAFTPEVMTKRERRAAVPSNCSEVESPSEPGLHKVKDMKLFKDRFFIKPEPGFRKLVFHMKINNMFNMNEPYVTEESIVFNSWELENMTHNSWVQVEIEYFRHKVRFGRDKHGLRVKIGRLSRTMRSNRWWRTHSYEGFVLLVEGPSKLLFNCIPPDIAKAAAIQTMPKQVVLGGVVGGVVLVLAVAAWVCLIVTKRQRNNQQHPDHTPPVPPLPKSLLLWRGQVKSDPDPTYQDFDEDTLTRLRQKLDPKTFGSYNATSEAAADGGQKAANADREAYETLASPYENLTKLSLLEEKQKVWEEDHKGQEPESHYVEMHGIINRNSDLGQ